MMTSEQELLTLEKEELIKRLIAWRNLIIPLTHGPYGFQRPDIYINFEDYYNLKELGEMP